MADTPDPESTEPVASFPRFSFDDLKIDIGTEVRRSRPDPAPALIAVPSEEAPVGHPASFATTAPSLSPPESPPYVPVPAPAAEPEVDELVAAVAGPDAVVAESASMAELRTLLATLRQHDPVYDTPAVADPAVADPTVAAAAVGQAERVTEQPVPASAAPVPASPAPMPASPAPMPPARFAPEALAAIPDAPVDLSGEVPAIVVASETSVTVSPASPASPMAPAAAAQPAAAQPAAEVQPAVMVTPPPVIASVALPPVTPAAPAVAPAPMTGSAAVNNDPTFLPAAHLVAPTPKPAMPALRSGNEYAPPRPAAARVVAPPYAPPVTATQRRRKSGSLLRKLFTLVIIVGMIGGGAYAAKRYVLDIGKWADDVKPLADGVAQLRGLSFKDPVAVVELPVEEYATRLATSALGPAFADAASRAPELRAVGLLQGELDLVAIGETAMIDAPAFYDGVSKKIFIADLPAISQTTREFALRRALAQALLDQHFAWSTEPADASASLAVGRRLMADGDALSVASSLLPSESAPEVISDQLQLVQQYGYTTNSPYLAAIAGRAGVVMAPTFHGLRQDPAAIDLIEAQNLVSDGGVLDLVRGAGSPMVDAAVGSGETMGMAYWYYALASRLDSQQAWIAATNWAGDTTTVAQNAGGACVTSTISSFTEAGAAALQSAFDVWAAVAPLESRTTVQSLDNNRISVMACDPGVATVTMKPEQPILFGGAPVERALVESIVPDPSEAVGVPVCLTMQARFRNLPFSLPSDQSPLLGLAGGWTPPYVTANLDLGATCLAAPAPAAG